MKYIRTKDGRILTADDNSPMAKLTTNKVADTPEELCDKFIFIYKDAKTGETKFGTAYDNWIKDKDYIKEYSKYPLYGMIWVFGKEGEPTLKPVAKYNKEEGKFELL